jgi:methylenetetrahydrofolate reductase (NADPH)
MAVTGKARPARLLIVGPGSGLADSVREAAGPRTVIESASDAAAALDRVRSTRPDIVVILADRPIETQVRFYRDLREGWISRHSSVLLLATERDGSVRVLDGDMLDALLLRGPVVELPAAEPSSLAVRLKAAIEKELDDRRSVLRDSLSDPNGFCVIWEQIPGLGSFERRQESVLLNARKAAAGGKVCAISVTDNPGGNPGISNEVLAAEIKKLGVEPLVHVAFRDRSRNQCESLLYQLAAMDLNNVLVLTGDYPPSGKSFRGTSRPVFDLDSVTGLELIGDMNRGMEHEIMGKMTRLAPTDFFTGVAVAPFKRTEAEVMGQYFKLRKKLHAGAGFIVTQVGYDARKLHELQLWLRAQGITTPAVVTIYVLSRTTARAMNRNRVPGCVVTDGLLEQIESETADTAGARHSQLERAARMYAIARGLGFSGASIAGQGISYENVEYIVSRGQELLPAWPDLVRHFAYPQPDGFYLYQASPATGLNADTLISPAAKRSRPLVYYISMAAHRTFFEPKGLLFRPVRWLARRLDRSRSWSRAISAAEHLFKVVLYGCQNCGDCALFDVAYLCPVSQCPKNQRNGPCGGSFEGWCEVYPGEKKCIWVRAYQRGGKVWQEQEAGVIVPPCDWSLWQTSSWLNYFGGRDYLSRRLAEGTGRAESHSTRRD